MTNECITPDTVVNPLRDIDFDVSVPDGWYRYVADSFVRLLPSSLSLS